MALTTIGEAGSVQARVEQTLRRRADVSGTAFRGLLIGALGLSILIIAVLLVDVTTDGWPVLSSRLGDFLSAGLRSQPGEAGVFQGLRGTFWICVFVIMIAVPLGIGAAVYIEEYAPKNRLTNFIEINIRNLAGVPSVVYGILGLTIFVQGFGFRSLTGGSTVLAAGITLAVLVLPIVIITASEGIRSVPSSLREAGYGVGATKWQVIRTQVLPFAAPSIMTGTLLSVARAAGEAAPLILIGAVTGRLGSNTGFLDPAQFRERFTAMPTVITTWVGRPQEEFKVDNASAAIVVLLVVILVMNSVAVLLRNRFERKREGR